MSNNLVFSLEMRALTQQFTQAVRQARESYEQSSAAIRQDAIHTGTATNAAATALYQTLNLRPATTLRDEITRITQQLIVFRQSSGAPADEVARATQAATARITELRREMGLIPPVAVNAATAVQGIGASAQNIGSQISTLKNQMLAFAGVNFSASMVKDALATADAFNNLQARVKLATGAGEGFKQTFSEVSGIALRTSSSLEQTGILFARLSDAGKSAGLTVQASIAQSLRLTETINQAVQLSGGSAASSNAAITQLIQGLQSGVVRGEEFNSIMEQAPRLALALASGLGVTTGELRKMSEAGALSTDVVIKAIKSQSAILEKEFGTLPATVGRAIENLKTQWTLWIGELDTSKGVTGLVSKSIEILANNLNAVIQVLTTGAALYVGNIALQKLAGNTAQTAAVQVTTQAAASTQAALATRSHGLAATAASAQVGIYGAAAGAATNAIGGAGTSVLGRFAGMSGAVIGFIGKLGTYGAIAVAGFQVLKLANDQLLTPFLKKISGLTAAEKALQEQTDNSNRAVKAHIAMLEGMALSKEKAANAAFNLSKQAVVLAASFDTARKSGDTAAEAVAKIGKDFDLSTVKGIKDAGGVLDKLKDDGKITAAEFEKAWADALNNQDLMNFEILAKTAFGTVGRDATQLAQAMDASIHQAVMRTGLDFELISGGMGKASRSAINDTQTIIEGLDSLKSKGVDVSQVLNTSIGKSIETAKTTEALSRIKQQIESVKSKLGETVVNGLLDEAAKKAVELKQKLEESTAGIQSVGEAFRILGLKTREESAVAAKTFGEAFEAIKISGKATTQQLQDSFKKYAEAAIAANGGVSNAILNSSAAAIGLKITVDSTGNSVINKVEQAKISTDKLSDGFSNVGMSAENAAVRTISALEHQISVQEKSLDLARRQKAISDAQRGVDAQGFSLDATGNRAVANSQNKSEFIKEAISKGLSQEEAIRLADESSSRENRGTAPVGFGLGGNGGVVETFNSNKFYEALEKTILDKLRNSGSSSITSEKATDIYVPQPPAPAPIPKYEPENTGSSITKKIDVTFILEGRKVSAKVDSSSEYDFLSMLEKARGVA